MRHGKEFKRWADQREDEGHRDLARRIRIEGRVTAALVDAILATGATVSVHDSEEWAVKRSTDRSEIVDSLFTTDQDELVARDADGNRLGWFMLIYGNDGTDVVSDYSANEYCEAIWQGTIRPLCDKIEAGR